MARVNAIRTCVAFLALALSSVPVAAQQVERESVVIPWEVIPDISRLSIPPRAAYRAEDGHVLLDCLIGDDRRPNCTVLEEHPPQRGLAQSALRFSREYLAPPALPNGVSTVGLSTRIRIEFDFDGLRQLTPQEDMFWDSGAILQFYPRRARRARVEGWVELDCAINGRLRYDCTLASETPERWGFGEAALRMMRNFYLSDDESGRAQVGQRKTFRVHFREQR